MGLGAPIELRMFKFKELSRATQQFKEPDNVLGEGGFGKVYRGTLREFEGARDYPIAVKKLNPNSFQGQQEWLVSKPGVLRSGRLRGCSSRAPVSRRNPCFGDEIAASCAGGMGLLPLECLPSCHSLGAGCRRRSCCWARCGTQTWCASSGTARRMGRACWSTSSCPRVP